MQDKTNYCVVDIDKYEDLIYNNVELNKRVKELQKQLALKNDIFDYYENYYFERVIANEEYHLKNFKDYNDYHYIQLANCNKKIGIVDNDYIDRCILKIKEKFEENKGVE